VTARVSILIYYNLYNPRYEQTTEERLEEQRKFGVFYDDEYDYLQHLRDVNELQNVSLGDPHEVVVKDTTESPKEGPIPEVSL